MKLYSCNCNLFIVVWHGGQKEVFSCSSINKTWFNRLFGWVIVLSSCCNTPWLFKRTIRWGVLSRCIKLGYIKCNHVNILVSILFLHYLRCGIHNLNSRLINELFTIWSFCNAHAISTRHVSSIVKWLIVGRGKSQYYNTKHTSEVK